MLLKWVRHKLLKYEWWCKAVADYKRRQKEQAYKERWAMLLRDGGAIRQDKLWEGESIDEKQSLSLTGNHGNDEYNRFFVWRL